MEKGIVIEGEYIKHSLSDKLKMAIFRQKATRAFKILAKGYEAKSRDESRASFSCLQFLESLIETYKINSKSAAYLAWAVIEGREGYKLTSGKLHRVTFNPAWNENWESTIRENEFKGLNIFKETEIFGGFQVNSTNIVLGSDGQRAYVVTKNKEDMVLEKLHKIA